MSGRNRKLLPSQDVSLIRFAHSTVWAKVTCTFPSRDLFFSVTFVRCREWVHAPCVMHCVLLSGNSSKWLNYNEKEDVFILHTRYNWHDDGLSSVWQLSVKHRRHLTSPRWTQRVDVTHWTNERRKEWLSLLLSLWVQSHWMSDISTLANPPLASSTFACSLWRLLIIIIIIVIIIISGEIIISFVIIFHANASKSAAK